MQDLIIDFEVLARVAKERRSVKAGDVIFRAGDRGSEFYVVRDGSIAIQVGEQVVEHVGPSGVFGEMAMVDAKPRSATAIAATDSVIVPLSEKQFVALVREAPYFALAVMRVLAQRLRAADAEIAAR
ncbi:MAG: Crp/Fnr family transcriptional regulator [Devosia sp.]|nr:cyclic nucleotide-binding domain-containing protein [Devosiaceae bacterium]